MVGQDEVDVMLGANSLKKSCFLNTAFDPERGHKRFAYRANVENLYATNW